MTFKSEELKKQLRWKNETTSLSAEAKKPGLYTGPARGRPATRNTMFLHESRCEENLLPSIRNEALEIFRRAEIPWHDGPGDGRPSNYLMDSQVSCVNCLLPFAHEPAALAALLRPVVPHAVRALPVEDGRVLAFEWMGEGNPLEEKSPNRRRGSHGTSADAYCVLERVHGGRTGVLIEWKYTESYLVEKPKYGEQYRSLLEAPDGPVDLALCGGVEALFVDPLYQLARLQMLAQAMERVGAADRVMVLVVVPEGNRDFQMHVPGEALRNRFPGTPLPVLWSRLLHQPERFSSASFDDLLCDFPYDGSSAIMSSLGELRARYVGPALIAC